MPANAMSFASRHSSEWSHRLRGLALLWAVVAAAPSPVTSSARAQQATASAPTVSITGAVPTPLTLSASDLAAMPRVTVSTTSNGIVTTYSGVLISEVLKRAGVPFGAGMRGRALAGYLIAAASDGYQVVFSLGELDPDLTDGQYLLADSANGQPLFGEQGAFRLVVPKDKRGARSVRLLSSLTVVQVSK